MAIIISPYMQVLAAWPVLPDDIDPDVPSPWQRDGIVIPPDPTPLTPTIAIQFSRPIAPVAYASNGALSNYVFLTSLTNPAATNITQFTDVAFNTTTNVLTFAPISALAAGDRYQGTVRSNLPDAEGRLITQAYSWEFEVSLAEYDGLPIPTLLTPITQSVIIAAPIAFTWGIDPSYTAPAGYSLFFTLGVYADQEKATTVWSGKTPAGLTAVGAYVPTSVCPAFPENALISPGLYFWDVTSQLQDASGNTLSVSAPSPLSDFYVDLPGNAMTPPQAGPGADTYPALLQRDPLVPSQVFKVIRVGPEPGFVVQDLSCLLLT